MIHGNSCLIQYTHYQRPLKSGNRQVIESHILLFYVDLITYTCLNCDVGLTNFISNRSKMGCTIDVGRQSYPLYCISAMTVSFISVPKCLPGPSCRQPDSLYHYALRRLKGTHKDILHETLQPFTNSHEKCWDNIIICLCNIQRQSVMTFIY